MCLYFTRLGIFMDLIYSNNIKFCQQELILLSVSCLDSVRKMKLSQTFTITKG